MSDKDKASLLEVVEFAASKLNIKKGATYNAIKEAIESSVQEMHNLTSSQNAQVGNDDWLEAAKPQVRIHRSLESCEACSA